MWRSSVFLGVSNAPSQGDGAQRSPKIFGTSYMRAQYEKQRPNLAW